MNIKSNFPINERAIASLDALWKEYDQLSSVEVEYNNPRQKDYLEDITPGKCRFCGKEYPLVTFKKDAHTIPDFMGNKSLFSKFECDSCNQYFSKLENELANFMLPFNALAGVKNKSKKSTKYRQGITVYKGADNELNIENFPDEIPLDNREIQFDLNIPAFIPDYAYRCLVKIGLSLLPGNCLIEFENTFKWLLDLTSDTIFPGSMLFSIFPFESRLNGIRCVLLKAKRPRYRNVPSVLLLLSYQNFSFQTFVPLSIFDPTNQLSPFPHIIPSVLDLNSNVSKEKSFEQIDLCGKEKIKVATAEIRLNILER